MGVVVDSCALARSRSAIPPLLSARLWLAQPLARGRATAACRFTDPYDMGDDAHIKKQVQALAETAVRVVMVVSTGTCSRGSH